MESRATLPIISPSEVESIDDAMVRSGPLSAFGPLAVFVGALWLLDRLLPDAATLIDLGTTWLTADPITGALLFLLGGAVLVALGLPRQSVSLVAGYCFGTVAGTALALAATLAGCVAAYHSGQLIGAGPLQRRWPAAAARLDSWTRERVFAKTLMVRLFPVGSNLATNLVAGAARAPRGPFFAGSLVGFVPQTLVFALAGTSVGAAALAPLLVSIGLLLISAAIAAWLLKSNARCGND